MSHRVSSELLAYLHTKHCVNIRSPKGDARWRTAAVRIENKKKQQLSRQETTDLAHVCMCEAVFLLSETPPPWFLRPLPSTFSRICGFTPEVATRKCRSRAPNKQTRGFRGDWWSVRHRCHRRHSWLEPIEPPVHHVFPSVAQYFFQLWAQSTVPCRYFGCSAPPSPEHS